MRRRQTNKHTWAHIEYDCDYPHGKYYSYPGLTYRPADCITAVQMIARERAATARWLRIPKQAKVISHQLQEELAARGYIMPVNVEHSVREYICELLKQRRSMAYVAAKVSQLFAQVGV